VSRARRLVAALLLNCSVLLVAALATGGDNASRLGSVGLQVVPVASGELVVLQVPAGTPAARADIKAGDLIVQIDDLPLAGSDFADVVAQHLWGVEGSSVTIHYLRPGVSGRKTITLRRALADPKLTVSPAVRNSAPSTGGKP
jgi:C-terminal processing protease CtpA/Prc